MLIAMKRPVIQGNMCNIKCTEEGRDSAEFECCWENERIDIFSGSINNTASSDGKKSIKIGFQVGSP